MDENVRDAIRFFIAVIIMAIIFAIICKMIELHAFGAEMPKVGTESVKVQKIRPVKSSWVESK